jgi:drug/metabolite transporter (DMT)-like permease
VRSRVADHSIGILAALTFGVSAPFAVLLERHTDAQMLAGLLYAGALIGLLPMSRTRVRRGEARLKRSDAPRVGLITASGGVAAPILLLVGLRSTGGLSGSLLLNLEAPLTIGLAVLVFGEHLGRRSLTAALVIIASAAALSAVPRQGSQHSGSGPVIGAVLIAAACALWALDNNVTASLSLRDPATLITFKVGASAATNLSIAALRGVRMPSTSVTLGALTVGALSYGLSVLLDAHALRRLGAAREAALFACAPFAGAGASMIILGESVHTSSWLCAAGMVAGVVLLLTDQHGHPHQHEAVVHEHRHSHDEHHRHDHPEPVGPRTRHSHAHEHQPVTHTHPHVSDRHHQHAH